MKTTYNKCLTFIDVSVLMDTVLTKVERLTFFITYSLSNLKKLCLHSMSLQAFLIRSYHKRIWLYNLYKRYYDYILRCGNPYIKSYDDRQVVLDRKVKSSSGQECQSCTSV